MQRVLNDHGLSSSVSRARAGGYPLNPDVNGSLRFACLFGFFPLKSYLDFILIQSESNFCYFYICDIRMTLHCYTAADQKSGTCGNCRVKPLKVTHALVMLMILENKC